MDTECFPFGHIVFTASDELEGTGIVDLGLMMHMPIFVGGNGSLDCWILFLL